ncbi:MAG: AAA family ATPase, partial [Streptococcus gallolyticus]|nr:AAA family ATPase [Streptococcus gallolyticus]
NWGEEFEKVIGEIPTESAQQAQPVGQAQPVEQPQQAQPVQPQATSAELLPQISPDAFAENDDESGGGFFMVKKASDWMDSASKKPIPKMLFSQLWFEGECCILFADTGMGKSILAVQIADSISYGKPIKGFKLEAEKQLVLYFDFELTEKQFELRYINECGFDYKFSPNFLRSEINPDCEIPDNMDFEVYLNYEIEKALVKTGAKVVIIDNITYLRSGTEKAADALPLMKHLKKLKNKYNLSMLILAHTPKRNLSNPITRNDLQGSKMLINFCDSCFAIGESSKDKSLRYIKQIKQRNCEQVYDADNVAICELNKPDDFVQFDFKEFSNESEHLQQVSKKDKDGRNQKIKELADKGWSQRDIAKEVGLSASYVNRILKKFAEEDEDL